MCVGALISFYVFHPIEHIGALWGLSKGKASTALTILVVLDILFETYIYKFINSKFIKG